MRDFPLASGSVANVTIFAARGGSSGEISWTREKVEAKSQPVYESVFLGARSVLL